MGEGDANTTMFFLNYSSFVNNKFYLKNEKGQIEFLQLVIKSYLFKVYVSPNKKYLIISSSTPEFIYNRVFNINTGKFIFESKDNLQLENNYNLILDPSKTWVRTIGNTSIVLNQNNDIVSFIQDIKLEPIKYKDHKRLINPEFKTQGSVTSQLMANPNFGVFDLETLDDIDQNGENYSRVYALGFITNLGAFNAENFNDLTTYYLTDHFPNTLDGSACLVLKCIDSMLIPKYNKFYFYVHNLGRFDVVFLFKILLDYNLNVEEKYIVEPLYRDNQIIRLVLKLKVKKNIKITFLDSVNLSPSSLEKLGIDYEVLVNKGFFPYSFVNKDNLNYVGPTPDIKFYKKNIDTDLYNSSLSTHWSLREETLSYLKKDLKSLLEVLVKFQKHLWEDHNIEMTEGLTISSLAKTKFFKYYLKDSKIPLINSNNLFNFIYLAYYGGITEVYKPYGQDLTYLDVNSLYPFAAKNPMPGCECKWVESYGDQGLDIDKLFGVFHAEVITNDLYIGLLPVKTQTGIMFPNGKFEGVWTSIELQFAVNCGYLIKVTKGFQFNKEYNVFDTYIDELSQLKDTLKGSQRQVVKNLLNHLSGRFALNFVKPITKTVHKPELDKILATKEVKTFKQINDNNFIVTFVPVVNRDICISHNLDYYKVILNERKQSIVDKIDVFQDVSIIISAFVTAYARVHMHKIKLDILENEGSIYYSDTDSIATNLSLEKLTQVMQERIGNKLGQLKFEHVVREGYFITNKTYALLVEGGKVIKKAKGVSPDSLSYSDFKDMYLHSKSIQGEKTSGEINQSKGSVTIKTRNVTINWNSYKKREKVYNPKTNLWTDTRPLYFDNLTKSITVYIPKN